MPSQDDDSDSYLQGDKRFDKLLQQQGQLVAEAIHLELNARQPFWPGLHTPTPTFGQILQLTVICEMLVGKEEHCPMQSPP